MATSKRGKLAEAATAGLFMQAVEVEEKPKAKRGRPPKTQQVYVPVPKRETVTFSVKIDSEVAKRWRYYASAYGYGDKGRLTEAAITEYMNRHKLSPELQAKVDLMCKVDL